MREFKKFQIEKAKNDLKLIYKDYDTLLELTAKLLLTINDAEQVINELSVSEIKPLIVRVNANGDESMISESHMFINLLASLGNEFAIQALDKIYPELTKGRKFKPARKKGSIDKKQKHINKLVAENPKMKAKELMRLADKNILDGMKDSTFKNNVTKARKSLL